MVEAEKSGLCLLEAEGALELVPHEAPEAGAVVLAARHSLQAQLLLQLHDLGDGLSLNLRQAGILRAEALVADGLADVKQLLGPQEGPHVLGAERRHGWKAGENGIGGLVWKSEGRAVVPGRLLLWSGLARVLRE